MLFGQGDYRYDLLDGWAGLPEGESFVDIGGLVVDSQDRVYVLNRGEAAVRIFDRDGNLLASWGSEVLRSAHGVCLGLDGCIYCTDDANHTVRKFSPEGQLVLTLGKEGLPSDTGYIRAMGSGSVQRGSDPFNRPTGVAVSEDGNIFVSDGYGNSRIHKFSPDGRLTLSWGEPGDGRGQFRQPHSVRLDKLGRLWVCDRGNSRIQMFSQDGDFLDEWSDLGGKPSDLFVDSSGEGVVYVALKSGDRPYGVSIFTSDGRPLSRWGNTETPTALFWSPHAIAVDSRGDIYLGEIRKEMRSTDAGSRALRKFIRRR